MKESNMPAHIEETQMDQYAMGILSVDLLPAVEEHLLSCPACQSRLEKTDAFLRAFLPAATQVEAQPAPLWTRILHARGAFWTAAPALAFLAVLIAVVPRGSLEPSVVPMQSLRGPESGAQVAAGRPLVLVFDAAAFDRPDSDSSTHPGYKVKILDVAGSEVLVADAGTKDGRISVPVKQLAPGSYWVRLYRHDNPTQLTAEYSLQAR
jgi:hypothetical protein